MKEKYLIVKSKYFQTLDLTLIARCVWKTGMVFHLKFLRYLEDHVFHSWSLLKRKSTALSAHKQCNKNEKETIVLQINPNMQEEETIEFLT